MNKILLGVALFGIASIFVSLEIFLHPEVLKKAEIPEEANILVEQDPGEETDPTPPPATPEETVLRPTSYFNVNALTPKGITLQEGKTSLVLFRHAAIRSTDDLYFVSFRFFVDGVEHGIVYRVIPKEDMSAPRLFALVRQKLEEQTGETEGIELSEFLSTVGEANFYLNDNENFADKTFLVTRNEKKVLAFEYPTEYHDSVKNLIPLFFE